jgi:hypothetical protein
LSCQLNKNILSGGRPQIIQILWKNTATFSCFLYLRCLLQQQNNFLSCSTVWKCISAKKPWK